jgi:hypothetical protein
MSVTRLLVLFLIIKMLVRAPSRCCCRWLSVRRSRTLIRAAGLEGSRGARLREVAYTAQQVICQALGVVGGT